MENKYHINNEGKTLKCAAYDRPCRFQDATFFVQSSQNAKTSYYTFMKDIYKYSASSLIELIAKINTGIDPFPTKENYDVETSILLPPWALTRIITEKILSSERRNIDYLQAKKTDISRLIQTYVDIDHNFEKNSHPIDNDIKVMRMIAPLFHEQQYYQNPIRKVATASLLYKPMNLPWHEEFGLPLEEAMIYSFVLREFVKSSGGLVNITPENYKDDDVLIDMLKNFALLLRSTSKSINDLKMRTMQMRKRQRDALATMGLPFNPQYSYVPFMSSPFIELEKDKFISPQSGLISAPFYTSNLYHIGRIRWDKKSAQDFSSPLGKRLEAYVGECLRTNFKKVSPEITYQNKKQSNKSVDWFVETKNLVVMLEVKSAGLTLSDQVGGDYKTTKDLIAKATNQINKSYELIKENHPSFQHLYKNLKDKKFVGLIVTLESLPYTNIIPQNAKIPCLTLSLQDVETLSGMSETDSEELLKDALLNPNVNVSWNIFAAAKTKIKNPSFITDEFDRLVSLITDKYDFLHHNKE